MKYFNSNDKTRKINEDTLSKFLSQINLHVYSAGIWNSQSIKKDAYYTINDIEFIFYTKGSSITTIKNQQFNCKENDFMILEPHQLYNSINPEGVECEYHFVHFEVSPISFQNELLQLFKYPVVQLQNHNQIRHLFKLIMEENKNQNPGYLTMINNYLKTMLVVFFRDQPFHLENKPHQNRSSLNTLTNQCIEYIQANIDKDLSNPVLAKKFNVSQSALYKCFIENLNISPNNYILEQRMKRAKNLIAFRQLKFEDIAQQVGYSSIASFSRTFKKYEGLSPTEFQKKQINKKT